MDNPIYQKILAKLPIKPGDIDKAALEQPVIYEQVTDEVSAAWGEFQALKLETEFLESETELRIRREKEEAGEKTTEGKIKALVDTDTALFQKKIDLLEAERTYQKWSNLKRSYDMRQESIRILASYFRDAMNAYSE